MSFAWDRMAAEGSGPDVAQTPGTLVGASGPGLALRLGLLTLLLDPGLAWAERLPVLVLAGGALLAPAAARSSLLWIGLTALLGVRLAWHCPTPTITTIWRPTLVSRLHARC